MNRCASRIVGFATLCLVLVVAPVSAHGQAPDPETEAERREMLERVEEYFEERLARELGLEPSQREPFMETLTEFSQRRQELLPRKRELMSEVRELLREGGSEERSRELILELRNIRQREAAILLQEEDRLLEILRPSQVLRLQILREQFRNEIQRLDGPDERDFRRDRDRGLRGWFQRFRR